MNRDEAIDLIRECLRPLTEQEKEVDKSYGDSYNKTINVRNDFNTKTVETYEFLQLNTVTILDTFSEDSGDNGDWKTESYVAFSYEHGYGLVSYIRTSDYTFAQEEHNLDLTESHDWNLFDCLCFTDDIRDKLKNIIAEMKLLT